MADATRRALERRARAGDADAAATLLVARLRAGDLDERALRLAGWLGHPLGRRALERLPELHADVRAWGWAQWHARASDVIRLRAYAAHGAVTVARAALGAAWQATGGHPEHRDALLLAARALGAPPPREEPAAGGGHDAEARVTAARAAVEAALADDVALTVERALGALETFQALSGAMAAAVLDDDAPRRLRALAGDAAAFALEDPPEPAGEVLGSGLAALGADLAARAAMILAEPLVPAIGSLPRATAGDRGLLQDWLEEARAWWREPTVERARALARRVPPLRALGERLQPHYQAPVPALRALEQASELAWVAAGGHARADADGLSRDVIDGAARGTKTASVSVEVRREVTRRLADRLVPFALAGRGSPLPRADAAEVWRYRLADDLFALDDVERWEPAPFDGTIDARDREGRWITVRLLGLEGPEVDELLRLHERLDHPVLVPFARAGRVLEGPHAGRPFVVEDAARLVDLEAWAARKLRPVDQALTVARDLAQGLARARALGADTRVARHDLFVDLSRRGRLRHVGLTGLTYRQARRFEGGSRMDAHRRLDSFMRLELIPPELLADDPPPPTSRSDVFVVAAVLYRLLAGRWHRALTQPAPLRADRPDVSPELEATILRSLSRDPADRPAACCAELDELLRRHAPVPGAG